MEPHVYDGGSGLLRPVSAEPVASLDGPGRRRDSWSLRTIVEEVGGRPISDFQDPTRPTHPYLKDRLEAPATGRPASGDAYDPIARVYPPLVGATGRSLHGQAAEHHAETLAALASEPPRPLGGVARAPGPLHRPERIYLHYLLLHLDRLDDAALAYLHHAVVEELDHRSAGEAPRVARPAAASGSPPPLPAASGT
jgi:hypothetical protein